MKRLCNRFCNFMQLYATLLLLPAVALAQDVPVPEPTPPEPAAETNTVPPVLLRDIRVQTIGEERHLEELPEGLLFVDATTGKLCLADENDPHGRYVCLCRDIDWHTFTNTVKFNGHRLEFNQFWSQVAEGGSLLYRFGTNSWLRLVGSSSGDFCPFTVDAYDPTNGTMVLTADVTSSPVLQVCTNLLEADAWQTATNAAVTTTTDASTTWTITLLGTPFETYRILATVHLPAGIHAERPLHANQGIEMAGVTATNWGDLTNALHAAVAALDDATGALSCRVVALETAAWSELYVQWPVSILSESEVNWIPTTNWPARSVVVNIAMGSMTNLTLGIPGGWEPDEDCMVAFRVLRGGSSGSLSVRIGENYGVSPITSGNYRYVFIFRWLAEPKTWVLWRWNLTYVNAVFDSSGQNKESSGIPQDERFLPVIVEEEDESSQTLSMSPALAPSLTPFSPSILQPADDLELELQQDDLEPDLTEEAE